MSQKKIVVIEDEPDILEIITYNLKRESFDVVPASTGEQGLRDILKEQPDLVLLDLMLPSMNGLEVCSKIKADPTVNSIPIILVTAKGEESDIVLGLGIGADDYISKPFSPRELVARVRAVIRRCENTQKEPDTVKTIAKGDLLIDPGKHKVLVNQTEIIFTPTEFKMLYFLASKAGRVFTREQIINNVLGSNAFIVDRNMDVHIRSIRKKLGESNDYIETIRGIGYRFKD